MDSDSVPGEAASPVEAACDAWSATYDDAPNPTRDLEAAVSRAQPFELAGKEVVAIGCGTGKHTVIAAPGLPGERGQLARLVGARGWFARHPAAAAATIALGRS